MLKCLEKTFFEARFLHLNFLVNIKVNFAFFFLFILDVFYVYIFINFTINKFNCSEYITG